MKLLNTGLISLLLTVAIPLSAQTPDLTATNSQTAENNFMASATKVSIAPKIDGEVLNEELWQAAKPIRSFWQTTPDEKQPASQKTEVRILHTNGTLYFGVICYDSDPSAIIVSDSRRDASLSETDCFQILLDTFNDDQNGFLFGTNPAGIEYDAQISNEGEGGFGSGSGGFNLNWDGAWEVKAQINETGWSAEFAIPFRTLRFSNAENQIWGLNFQRNIRRRNESSYWVKLPRQFNIQKISLAGKLEGLKDIQQKNLKLIPYVLTDINRDFENSSEYDRQAEFGFDLKYSLTSSMTLDATYNTDFAQVEADELQINLDRFSLFFPEKRPFFLENAGLFSIGNPGEAQLFFSRRIGISDDGAPVPIIGGVRLTGKAAGLNLGLINMQTDELKADSAAANNFAVARVSKELPNRSAIGGMFINRQGTGNFSPDDDYNRTMAIDGRLGIGKYGLFSGFAALTNTPNLKSDDYSYNLKAEYNSESWLLSTSYTEVGENFNPEVGFLRRSAYRNPTFLIFHRIRPENFIGIQELRPHISYRGFWDMDGFQETGFLHVDNHWEWKNGYEIHTGINFTKEGVTNPFEIFPGVDVPAATYDHFEAQIVAFTNLGHWWSLHLRAFVGGFFDGNRTSLTPTFKLRLKETFTTEFILNHNNVDLPGGDFEANLFQSRFSYSFTPKIYLQGLFQLNSRDDVGSLNVRLGWQRDANSGLFIVYNDTRVDENNRWNNRFRGLILKYSHLFDVLR
ncbi:MAG: DUF5916 domain-containing protein [Calditrichia bacterium]